jgi:transcriptional regulator with XRE-family HTH domain
MPDDETLGQRIRRVRQERGLSMAKVGRTDFSRAFMHQVEHGRAQPSTRVLRIIAGRLGTEVDYLLEGRLPGVERELALEKGRVLLARGEPRRALLALRPAVASTEWPLGTDARLTRVEALLLLGREVEAQKMLEREKAVISSHQDRDRLKRAESVAKRERVSLGPDPVKAHLRLADRAERAANSHDALDHYRAARVLLEARPTDRS